MSHEACSSAEAVERLSRRDPTLAHIYLSAQHTDAELAELADCLLAHPDVVTHVYLGHNRLTDETGVKLARYIAASSAAFVIDLPHNQFGEATYLALAAALRVNSSLRDLHLFSDQAVDRTCIEAAFIDALRLNPDRPAESHWQLCSGGTDDNDFERLKDAANRLGHPPLLLLSLF